MLAKLAPLPVFLVLDFCLKLISLPGKFLVRTLSLMAHQCVRTRASSLREAELMGLGKVDPAVTLELPEDAGELPLLCARAQGVGSTLRAQPLGPAVAQCPSVRARGSAVPRAKITPSVSCCPLLGRLVLPGVILFK